MIFDETKLFKFSEQDKLGRLSLGSSNILQVTRLEEGVRDPAEEPREESVIS